MAAPVRIAITADLHYDAGDHLTPPYRVDAEAEHIRAAKADAIILAGDLGHRLSNFTACLDLFGGFDVPVGVVLGNHDIWRDDHEDYATEALWSRLLPQAIARAGMVNLESENIIIGGVAIVGTIAWYDYSAIDSAQKMPRADIVEFKRQRFNDAHWLDWDRSDWLFAGEVGDAFQGRLARAAADPAVRAICVVTHVPVLEEQLVRKLHDALWGMTNAFFGNLTLGETVLAEPKVRVVVSGHTHTGREATVERSGAPLIAAYVVPSDYSNPAHIIVEL